MTFVRSILAQFIPDGLHTLLYGCVPAIMHPRRRQIETRSSLIGWARQNAAQLNWKISVDILCVISGDLTSNQAQIIQPFAGWIRLRTFIQHSTKFCSRPEAAIGIISGKCMRHSIGDKAVKLGDPRLNRSRQIQNCRRFFRDNCQPEVVSDVISSTAVD